MSDVSRANFGPLVAYLVPGATVLLGFSQFSPVLQSWFAATATDVPTIGGFLYLTVASIAAGMTVNAIRWVTMDTVHRLTGIGLPALDFSRLGPNVEAFSLLIEIHYHHYQFHANMVVATAIAYICYRVRQGVFSPVGLVDVGFIVLEAIFFAMSRDTLRKYYTRSAQLLSATARKH